MSAIGKAGKAAGAAVTLGGSLKFKKAQTLYQDTYETYQGLFNHSKKIENQLNSVLESIGRSMANLEPTLTFCQKVLSDEKLSVDQKNANTTTLSKLEAFNSGFNAALSAGFGSAIGGMGAAGAWTIVGLVGTASTGVGIGGLTGIAAYNATLAWFGGGALAAGGAGMAGGMVVLSSIVAAPIVLFSAHRSYSKAKKLKTETERIKTETDRLNVVVPKAEEELNSFKQYQVKVENLIAEFTKSVETQRKILMPFGVLSEWKQKALKLFGQPPFNAKKNLALEQIRLATENFVTQFNEDKSSV